MRVPDLLQTEAYTCHLLRNLLNRSPGSRLSDELHARRIRQTRLTNPEDHLTYTVVLDESTLRNPVGDRNVTRSQLTHIAEAASWPTVTVLVLPAAAAAPHPVRGLPPTGLRPPRRPTSPVHGRRRLRQTRRPPRTDQTTRDLLDLVASSALSAEASSDLVQHVALELNSPARGGQERKTA